MLARVAHHLDYTCRVYVAKKILGEYKMVAGIHITIKLDYSGVATNIGHCAHSGLLSYPTSECSIENLNEYFAYIMFYPAVKQSAKKIAPLLWCDAFGCE